MEKTNDKISSIEIGQGSMNKAAENVAERAVDSVVNLVKSKYGKACVATGNAFKLYLKNAEIRYNQVKTLADLSEPRMLEGPKGIYVDVFIKYKNRTMAVKTIEDLKNISNNVVIIGSGGTGKSMLIRHLFVNTHHRGSHIPVLVELRKLENADADHALLNLIHDCIESFDVKLNQEQFEYSLRTGKYLLLFDGLDEVKEELRAKTGQLIQEISKKYPDNCYIVSSRKEGVSFNELETYTLVRVCPFEKYQAVELVKKLNDSDEKMLEFAKLLDQELYDRHKDFASNPLLLTMMFITFADNNRIPEHLADFYESAYDALYKRHDANKEGVFKREYKCKKLGEREFKDLFAYFCFQSYFVRKYEFSKEEICQYVKNGVIKLGFTGLLDSPEMFFDDIKDIVCLIVEEGTKYRFAHRSFQMYFAAYYTVVHVTDEQQRIFFRQEIDTGFLMREDFFLMLYQLEEERFNNNILEPGIKDVLKKTESEEDALFAFLKVYCQMISIFERDPGDLSRGMNSSRCMDIPYERNILVIFEEIYFKDSSFYNKKIGKNIYNILQQTEFRNEHNVEIEDLLTIESIRDRNELLKLVYEYFGIYDLLKKIKNWLVQQKDRREKIKENKDREELLSLL